MDHHELRRELLARMSVLPDKYKIEHRNKVKKHFSSAHESVLAGVPGEPRQSAHDGRSSSHTARRASQSLPGSRRRALLAYVHSARHVHARVPGGRPAHAGPQPGPSKDEI